MSLIHKSDGKNGVEAGTFVKLNWGVILGIIVTISIAVFGIVNATNTAVHNELSTKMEKMASSITTLATTTSMNCIDIAVLKSESISTKFMLEKLDSKIDNMRRNQSDFYSSKGFKSKGLFEK